MFQRKPTRVQLIMIILMGIAFGALLVFLVPELIGVVNSTGEDTYSEWVWDLPLPAVISIAVLHGLAGVAFVWSAGHFIEGWSRRRRKEKKNG